MRKENEKTLVMLASGITIGDKIYYSMQMLARRYKISYKTVQRYIKKHTNNCSINEKLIKIGNNNYVTSSILEGTKYLKEKPAQIIAKNGIQKAYVKLYEDIDWDLFVSIHFESQKNQFSIHYFMRELAIQFKESISNSIFSEFTILYVIERNKKENSYHIHFLFQSETNMFKEIVIERLKSILKREKKCLNCDIKDFKKGLGGIDYIFKNANYKNFEHDMIESSKL